MGCGTLKHGPVQHRLVIFGNLSIVHLVWWLSSSAYFCVVHGWLEALLRGHDESGIVLEALAELLVILPPNLIGSLHRRSSMIFHSILLRLPICKLLDII